MWRLTVEEQGVCGPTSHVMAEKVGPQFPQAEMFTPMSLGAFQKGVLSNPVQNKFSSISSLWAKLPHGVFSVNLEINLQAPSIR